MSETFLRVLAFSIIQYIHMKKNEYFLVITFQLNPEHTVPTLDDNGFIIWDCHAICAYLVDRYARDDRLYPRDLRLRGICNQRMFFNSSNLSVRLLDIGTPIIFGGETDIPQEKVNAIDHALNILDVFLEGSHFLVGAGLTIADICSALTIPFLAVFTPISEDRYPNIVAWSRRISQTIPFFDDMNGIYPEQYRQLIQDNLQRNRHHH